MNRKFQSKLWLRFMISVFAIMILTFFVIIAITLIFIHLGFFSFFVPKPLFPIISLVIVSMIISSFFTLLIGQKILGPIQTLIDATKKVAKGDFSIRLDETYPMKEIRDMNIHFNKMIGELNGIETLRNDFVVNVSHEFKTPIAAIEGYATLLQDPVLSEEERIEYSQMILDSSKQLSSLSINLLRLSEFETQEIMLERSHFSLDEQLRQALLLLENKWTKKNIDIDMDLPSVSYYGNEDFLMQVWLNLFGNAIKFTPEKGTIATTLKKSEDGIYISISDTGIGMSGEVQKHIFEKFYQGDKTRSSEGHGLGLALVKRIIDLFEGRIEVQSKPGEGTTFTVWLPL